MIYIFVGSKNRDEWNENNKQINYSISWAVSTRNNELRQIFVSCYLKLKSCDNKWLKTKECNYDNNAIVESFQLSLKNGLLFLYWVES